MAKLVVVVGQEGDVVPGQTLRVVAGGVPIAIFNVHGELYAIGDTCTHEEFSLSDGDMVDDYTVECALHGAQFDVRTGAALCLPATEPEVSYPVWIEDGLLKVEVQDG
jgi:3-phenylpropionate/trans-cinnamate dioxygenase ferredoxin subunit